MAYEYWIRAKVHRGGVTFTVTDTNPQWGGDADAGSRTFAQVLAGDVPEGFEDLEALRRQVRDLPVDDGPDAWDPEGYPRIVRAAYAGDRGEVVRLLAAGADVNARGLHQTALVAATNRRDREMVELLLAAGADPNTVPLILLISPGNPHAALLDRLLAAGAKPTSRDLVHACAVGCDELVKRFLDMGARPEQSIVDGPYADLIGRYTRRDHAPTLGAAVREVTAQKQAASGVRDALQALLAAVTLIGEANDAMDHGARESADVMYASAPVRAREAWALAPDALASLLPELAPVMSTGQFDTSRWWQYADAIEAVLRSVR